MAINGIGAVMNQYQNIASGKRISNGSDDAAGLSISQKLESQLNGISKGVENGESGIDLLKTAEGGASGIGDQLQRMKELALQASNGILTDGDKQTIQDEISQIKQGIQDIANNTQFNTQKLINGNFMNKNMVLGANGEASEISINSLSLEGLGLENFDVTEEFDISEIEEAIETVSGTRSDLGSKENRLSFANRVGKIAGENIANSKSSIEDSDVVKEMMKMKSNQILEQFKISMQKNDAENKKRGLGVLYGTTV
jgi:flagellin